MNSGGGYLAQRSMACPSDREAQIAGLPYTWLQILLRNLFWLVIAIGPLVCFPQPGGPRGPRLCVLPRGAFVQGIDALMAPGLRGLMMVGLLEPSPQRSIPTSTGVRPK